MNELVGGPNGARNRIYFEAVIRCCGFASESLMIWAKWSASTPILHLAIAVVAGIDSGGRSSSSSFGILSTSNARGCFVGEKEGSA